MTGDASQTSPPPSAAPAAGWYDDPRQPGHQRYWDGTGWTDQTQPSGAPANAPGNVVYVTSPGNGMAVAALVLGIIGVLCGLIPILFFLAWILGILALVFGLIARGRAKKRPEVGRKTMATWGAVLGAAAIALGVVGVVIVNDVFEDAGNDLQDFGDCIAKADTPDEIDACSD